MISRVLAGKCFPEVLGESKNKVKKVMWSDIVQIKVIKDESDMLYFKYSYRVTISLKQPIKDMLK